MAVGALTHLFSAQGWKLLDNLLQAVGPLLGAFWGLQAVWNSLANRQKEEGQFPWAAFWLGLSCLSFSLGAWTWCYYEMVLHRATPFPSLSDVGFVCVDFFMPLGILALPLRPTPPAARGRIILDGLIIMTSLTTLSWYFVLGPTWQEASETVLAKFLSVAYPAGDLVFVSCLWFVAWRTEDTRMHRVIVALASGLAAIILSDSFFGYQTLQGTYATGNILDMGWVVGFPLVGYAASLIPRQSASASEQPPFEPALAAPQLSLEVTIWRSLLPYALIPVLALLVVHVVRDSNDATLENGVYFGGIAAFSFILLRQVMAILENNHLYALMHESYRQLAVQHDELEVARKDLEAKNCALEEANVVLGKLATTDGLTGIRNHRAFLDHLQVEFQRGQRHGFPISLLLMDVDYFKQYNDSFGHPAGDGVLKDVAAILAQCARPADFVARYGGEEFVVILPHTDAEGAVYAAERYRRSVERKEWPGRQVTVSIGIATMRPNVRCETEITSLTSFVKLADMALYEAKAQGRNRVVHHDVLPQVPLQ